MEINVKINIVDLNTLLYCSFCYALGRQTYIVESTVNIILNHLDKLDVTNKFLMKHRIEVASEANHLGMDMDAEQWLKLHTALCFGGTL